MSPQGKERSKNSRSGSSGRGGEKGKESKDARFAMGPLVIAVLLIGAIALGMGVTIYKKNKVATQATVAPSVTPETGTPAASGDPAQSNPAPTSDKKPAPSNNGGAQQVLTN